MAQSDHPEAPPAISQVAATASLGEATGPGPEKPGRLIARASQSQALDELIRLSPELGLYETDCLAPAKPTFRGKGTST